MSNREMINMFEGLTEKQANNVMNKFAVNPDDTRVAVDAWLMMGFIFSRFWESVNTGEPVDTSDWCVSDED